MSFIRAAWRYGVCTLTVVGLSIAMAAPARAQEPSDPNTGALTFTGGIDFLNQYMFRGIRQNSTEMAMWPYGDLGIEAYSGDGGLKSVGINFGVWNSLHTGDTGQDGPSGKLWYESDFYATLGLGFGGGVTFGTTYTAYTSPNNTFSTVKELSFKLALDDSDRLGGFALSPYVLYARELDTEEFGGQADGGHHAGNYIELGIAPGLEIPSASFAVPIKVGLSAGDYYENPLTDEDETFGFFSIAGIATVPLGGATRYGSWNVHGGVEYQRLGDTAALFNADPDTGDPEKNQVIFSIGIGFSY